MPGFMEQYRQSDEHVNAAYLQKYDALKAQIATANGYKSWNDAMQHDNGTREILINILVDAVVDKSMI